MAASGCTRRQLGLPRIELEVPSPDGQTVAYVRNHMGIDPPFQSLWIRTGDGKKTRLKRLGPDVDWCNTIVWSADGSRAGFLVQDARLIVAEVGAREVVLEEWLVPAPRHYPTREVVRELALSDDGKVATYRLCSRRRAGCEPSREFALP